MTAALGLIQDPALLLRHCGLTCSELLSCLLDGLDSMIVYACLKYAIMTTQYALLLYILFKLNAT